MPNSGAKRLTIKNKRFGRSNERHLPGEGERMRLGLTCCVSADTQRTLLAKEGTMKFGQIFRNFRRELGSFSCPKLEHGTDYFTSPPKEGILWIFPIGKIRRLRSGANPRSWVPEASMLTARPPKSLNCR
jgi:hypothetical protein